MDIKNITYFVELAKEKNFTRASNNLHISQPALSKAIKLLEHEINTKLIERNTKMFKLTQQGEVFFENAKKALDVINFEMYKLEDSLTHSKKVLKLGLPPVIGAAYFPSIIAKFQEEYPDVKIQIIEEGSNEIREKVKDEEIELGVTIIPIKSKTLTTIPIAKGHVVLVVNKKHKLASKRYIDIKELKDEKFITFNEDFMMYDKTIGACKECGFEPDIILKTSQWDFIIEMISLNQGITIIPKPIVKRFKLNDIKMIPIKSPEISWDIGFILKNNEYISTTTKLFIEYVRKNIYDVY